MFSQILRAFAAKANDSNAEDAWGPVNEFHYVREFLTYFRSMGYPLLRGSDYPRFDAFTDALARLRESDLVEPRSLTRAIDECVAFQRYLEELFARIGQRRELVGVQFDRRQAAIALKLYLGASPR
jgi:hypothetical protein